MTSPTDGAPPIHHQWIARPGDANRLAAALVRVGFTDRRQLTGHAILIAAAISVIVLASILDNLPFIGGGIAGLLSITILAPWLAVRRARTNYARIAFPGAHWAIGFGPTTVVVHQPRASVVLGYSEFSSVRAGHGGTVILRYADPRLALVLPDELCPPQACDFLSAAIHRHR